MPVDTSNGLFPHAHLVPRDVVGNLRWRKYVHELAAKDPQYRRDLMGMCKEDPLFWVLTFAWLLEPRIMGGKLDMPSTIPFCFWPVQEEAFAELLKSMGQEDAAIVKSRAVGASWLCLMLFLWAWIFRPASHFGLVSATEEKVDSPDDPDSLMSKLDYVLQRLPSWMVNENDYDRRTSNHTLSNRKNQSTITGYAATGDVARGGRKLAFMFDEMHSFKAGEDSLAMDSTQYVTFCRFFISTPSRRRGPSGTFYDIVKNAKTGANSTKLIELPWWKVPGQSDGMYKWPEDGDIEFLDPDYVYPDDYNFIRDGKLRSPWFDREWFRGGSSPQKIAAELELDFGATGATFFDMRSRKICEQMLQPPIAQGFFSYDPETWEATFRPTDKTGNTLIWKMPKEGKLYYAGADPAAGTGGARSNNSGLVIWDDDGELVLQFASHTTKPEPFADLCKAISLFYNTALLIGEVNGPVGQAWLNRITDIRYPRLWRRKVKEVGFKKQQDKIGYHNSDRGEAVLQALVSSIDREEAKCRSKMVYEELQCYAYVDGKLQHVTSKADDDESNKGTSHGDVAIAAAVGWHAFREAPVRQEKKPEPKEPTPESIGGRRYLAQRIRTRSSRKARWTA